MAGFLDFLVDFCCFWGILWRENVVAASGSGQVDRNN
jgi:hypothetical protein